MSECACERNTDDLPGEHSFCCVACDGNGWTGEAFDRMCQHCQGLGWHA